MPAVPRDKTRDAVKMIDHNLQRSPFDTHLELYFMRISVVLKNIAKLTS